MPLNRIQKQFIRLATSQHTKWMRMPRRGSFRKKFMGGKSADDGAKVNIINAVTGEITTAVSYNDTPAKLKKWLKLRNLRGQFSNMLIKKSSTWHKLPDDGFQDYPVIVKIGTAQYPYVIDHIGDRFEQNGKISVTVFLKITDNINYLSVINEKKKLLANLPKPVPAPVVKKKKVVKRTKKNKWEDFDE